MTTTLFRGGRVRSPVSPFATALVVDGDRIAWVGEEGAADGLSVDETVLLNDAFVTPAFVDAHVHATATGLSLTGLDLTGAATLTEALDAVARAASTGSPGSVLLGHGWDDSRWPERRPPTAAELERAAGPGSRVYLSRTDLHSAVATAALLDGVAHDDGRVRLADHHAVRARALAAVSAVQSLDAQRACRAEAARLGIGSLHEMGGPEVSSAEDLAALLALADAEPGPDVTAYWGELHGVDAAIALGAHAGGDLFCDGSFGSHTAALAAPYDDDPNTAGELRYDAPEIARHVVAATRAGLQAGFHAIGDRAVDAVLSGLELARDALGMSVVAARHRIEHAESLSPAAIARMAALGVVASVQPAFDARWATDMYVERLGAARAAATNPFALLAAAGVPLALGSDAPVTPLDPWGTIRAAVAAQSPLSARAAFSAHTRGGWRAARLDGDGAGELTPGSPATFAVWEVPGELVVQVPDGRISGWSTDPRAAVAGLPDLSPGLPDPRCLRTVVRGRTVYDAGR